MVYVPPWGRVMVFGGSTAIGTSDETWSYDRANNTWVNLNPGTRPAPRLEHAMVFNSKSGRVVLFGGFTTDFNDETWGYDYGTNTWTSRSPNVRPSPRCSHAMAYDPRLDRVILFGGLDATGALGETWSYGMLSDTWTKLNPSNPPSARFNHGMVYDSRTDRIILFGGETRTGISGETWVYDATNNTWTNRNPPVAPSSRSRHAMIYDSQADRLILYGGDTGTMSTAETWAYDFSDNKWTNLAPAVQPSARAEHAMAYDSQLKRAIFFAGSTGSGATNDTWEYEYAPTVPSAPRGFQASAGANAVNLSWQPGFSDGGSAITGYSIYRGTSAGMETLLTTVGNVLTYTDTGLTNGVTYYYQGSVVNAVGEGPRSAEVSATPTPPPDTTKPTIAITAPASGATLTSATVTVSGTASDNVAVQKVELSTDGTTWVAATGTPSWSGSLTLGDGAQTIHARATDTSGNTATVSIPVTVTLGPSGAAAPPWALLAVAVVGVAAVVGGAVWYLGRRRRPPDQGGKI